MNGSVVKKGGRWYVKVELDPDPATGRRRQKWHSGFATKREAERARIDVLSRLDRGVYVEPSRQTVGEYLAEWLTAIQPTVRPSTFDSYTRNVRLHVVANIGPMRLARLDAGVLNGLYAQLLASGRQPPPRQGAGYSADVVALAVTLRAEGRSLRATAETLRAELPEAANLSKDTLASLLRRNAVRHADTRRAGLDSAPSPTSTRSCTGPSRTPCAGTAWPATPLTRRTLLALLRRPWPSPLGTAVPFADS